nr:ATP-binding protein [Microvirga puerhi]
MRLQDNLWPALLDKNRLEVALLNLAVNAKHALSSGGRVTVETRNVLLSLADGVDDMTGHFVAITVMDTGTGMPPAIAARAFEPFFTTKEKGRGTGLGLPAVHALAKEFGGTAKIDSALGQGTRVTLYFPSASALTASDE